MKKNIAYLFSFFAATLSAHAQTTITTDWDEKPAMHSVADAFLGSGAVFIEDDVKIEYKDENDKLWAYRTMHRIVKVLDEKGIEGFNKMSIPTYDGKEIQVLKARTILPNGKVFEVTKDKMKVSKGDDGSSEIVFAMEGVEKNAEIELVFCDKKPFNLFGEETFQFSIPVMHAVFELSAPERLQFEEKGYNGFPTAKDTLIDNTRFISVSKSLIPAVGTEVYGFSSANRMRAEYKLSYLPNEQEHVRQYTWKDLAKRLYENSYGLSEKEKSAVEKYISSIGVNSTDNEVDKIRKIEGSIKNNITLYKEIDDDNAGRADVIIAKKSATETGLIRLFAACFVAAGVNHELGISTDRTEHFFDSEFENWNNMEYYVFYFPDLKSFLYPAGPYIRYPLVPNQLLTNKGVFLKLTKLGDVTNAIADIRTINPLPATASHINIDAAISFNPDMDAMADATYSFDGYPAIAIREEAVLLPKEQLKDLIGNIVNIADKPENIIKYSMANEAFDNYYDNKPFQVIATVKAPQLVEKAGNKYILKIGDVIGRQTELYQDLERKQPLDLDYPHYLNRTITVTIPDGYKILNPETINIHAEFKDADGKVTSGFSSDYKLEGNKLTVNIVEFYSQLHMQVSDYEAFRKVINASADFNKVNLLLAKQ